MDPLEQFHILAVDDEPNILSALRRTFAAPISGAQGKFKAVIDCFDNPFSALKLAEKTRYDVVISDYRMPDMNGVEFLLFFKAKQPDAVRLILSGYTDFRGLVEAINDAQIYRFVAKPWQDDEFKQTILQGLELRRLQLENARLASEVREERDKVARRDSLLRELELESPGITKVNWGPNGEVMLDDVGKLSAHTRTR